MWRVYVLITDSRDSDWLLAEDEVEDLILTV